MMVDVLLVEDSEDIAELLVMHLEAAGHRVRLGHNGLDGLRLVAERFPQLVVTDVEMPELDGVGMVRRMCAADAGQENIPVIMISSHPELREIAAAVGTPYFLEKPFDVEHLARVIERAASEARPPRPPIGRGQVPSS
jgi:two-component system C4-dicarboxylate transport response regulator DctD